MVPSCAEGDVLGILPRIIGIIQATEPVKIILDKGTTLSGRLLLYNALDMKLRELQVRPKLVRPVMKKLIDYEQFCGITHMKKRITLLARLLPLTCWLLVGCGQKKPSSVSVIETKPANLTVSAAISLKEAMADIKQLYLQENPNTTITYNFGSSGSLQQQIEQGAPVDVFISAASKQMNALQEKGLLIDNTRKNLLTNKIVSIAPKNTTNISNFKDLTRPSVKKIALGEPTSVPVGMYAQEVLTFFGVFNSVKPKVIYAKDARQIVSYVETGSVDVGIVYKTDAKQSNNVKIMAEAPENSHSPVIYPVAALKDSQNPAIAQDFVQFLSSKPADDVFAKHGFIKITKTSSIDRQAAK